MKFNTKAHVHILSITLAMVLTLMTSSFLFQFEREEEVRAFLRGHPSLINLNIPLHEQVSIRNIKLFCNKLDCFVMRKMLRVANVVAYQCINYNIVITMTDK